MIKQLRKKFILISIAAVASVMILLCAGVNIFNYISVSSKLDETLDAITLNHGRMPEPEEPFEPGGGVYETVSETANDADDDTDDPDEDPEDDPDEDPEDDPDDDTDEDVSYTAQQDNRSSAHRPGQLGRFDRKFDREAPFLTRFFVIRFDENGEPTDYNLEKIAAVSKDDVDDFARIAAYHGEGYGYESGYRYKVSGQENGQYMAVFLDCHKEMSSVITLLVVSVIVTLCCIALICLIIILFSRKAMEPVIQSDIRQKQFITDAGHELKTPITVINTCLSVLEMEVGKQKWIDKAHAQTEKLRDLVNSLVTLSKSDEEHAPVRTEFDAAAAASETVASFYDFAQQKGHPIKQEIENEIRFSGDEFSVRQLISILLDNALKYASEGSGIDFSMKKYRKGILITVTNKCDNLDREELPKLFDRFYRADKSRSTETGGFGLGLSIARGICENHKGYIRADSPDGGEITFTAYLSNM